MPIHDRAQLINRFADGIEARMAELYELETINNGRPITETKAQITRLAEWYRYNAALLLADRTSVVPLRGDYHAYTSRFPLGVVGILVVVQPPDDDRLEEPGARPWQPETPWCSSRPSRRR